MDAIKHQGERSDLTSRQVVGKLEAADMVGDTTGESGRQVQRYIRLTELIPELLDMVDTGQIKFNPAVELSYLAHEEQRDSVSYTHLDVYKRQSQWRYHSSYVSYRHAPSGRQWTGL